MHASYKCDLRSTQPLKWDSAHISKVSVTIPWQNDSLSLNKFSKCKLVYEILPWIIHICMLGKCLVRDLQGKIFQSVGWEKQTFSWPSILFDSCRPHVPKECRRPVEDPEMLSTACSRECKNGHCIPTGKCCCSSGWDGPFCLRGTELIRAIYLCQSW